MESAAVSVLKRAVEMDMKEQFTMALVLYQEGVQILLDTVKGMIFLRFSFSLFLSFFLSHKTSVTLKMLY